MFSLIPRGRLTFTDYLEVITVSAVVEEIPYHYQRSLRNKKTTNKHIFHAPYASINPNWHEL